MQVCVPSTPAQMFHMLRRQMKQAVPQAAHRHDAEEPAASQAVGVAARGSDPRQFPQRHRRDRRHPAANVTRIVFCSGKVYFDLLDSRRADGLAQRCDRARRAAVSVSDRRVRGRSFASTAKAREIVWCQEEPQNQGGWYQIRHRLQEPLSKDHQLLYAGPRAGSGTCNWHSRRCTRNSSRAWSTQRCALDQHEESLRQNARVCTARRQETGKANEYRSQSSATAGVGHRRDTGVLAQEAGRSRSVATRISSISKPTRSCWKCPRRPRA